jgi:hypothetical protein
VRALIEADVLGIAKAALVFAVALSACRPNGAGERARAPNARAADTVLELPAIPDTAEPEARVSILKALHRFGRGFGDDRTTVISRLGAPSHVVTRPATNGVDTLYLLAYPDASFLVSRTTADQSEILPDIRVWGRLPGLPPDIHPGLTTRSQLLRLLGPPDYTSALADSTVLSYQMVPDVTDLIEFYVVNERVRILRWRFYMG